MASVPCLGRGSQLRVAIRWFRSPVGCDLEAQMASVERSRPPGRGPKVRAAVLAATLDELEETGYAGLTIDSIARRAGVHKTTVYRRWPDRESLVADVVGEHIAMDFPI